MKRKQTHERGQILILLVLLIIGLLGFTALAIDGGMILADRRFIQSVADSSSIAGSGEASNELIRNNITDAMFSCPAPADSGSDPEKDAMLSVVLAGFNKALNHAREYYSNWPENPITLENIAITENTYVLTDFPLGEGNDIRVECDDGNNSISVYVQITAQTQTSFLQFVSDQLVKNTVEAKSSVTPLKTLTGGKAIWTICDCCKKGDCGLYIDGTTNTDVEDGDVQTDSCGVIGGTANSLISDGPIQYYEEWTTNGQPTLVPTPNQTDELWSLDPEFAKVFNDLEVECANMDDGHTEVRDGITHLYQGKFTSLIQTTDKEPMVFHPGLYCLWNTGSKPALGINGGHVIADGVTFVIMEGDVNIGGNAGVSDQMEFSARILVDSDDPDTEPDTPEDPEVPDGSGGDIPNTANKAVVGILFYVPDQLGKQQPEITLLGTSESIFSGTIYAPTSYVRLGGTSGTESNFGLSVIACGASFFGGETLNINNNDEFDLTTSGVFNFLK